MTAFTASAGWLALGWTMIHFLWVGLALFGSGLVLQTLVRNRAPALRHACALGMLVVFAAAPVALFCGLRGGGEAPTPHPQATVVEVRGAPREPVTAVEPPAPPLERLARGLPWVWLVGAPFTCALLGLGLLGTRRLRSRGVRLEEGPVVELCDALARRLHVGRRVALHVCDKVVSPVLVGVLKPAILLPPSILCGCTQAQLEMVLLHELAHVRRLDNAVVMFQRVVESLLFFHPATWALSRQVSREREFATDALVVAHCGQPRAYAETLFALAERRSLTPAVGAAFSRRHLLVDRICQILNRETRVMSSFQKSVGVAGTLGALLLFVMTVRAQEVTPAPPKASPKKRLTLKTVPPAECEPEAPRTRGSAPSPTRYRRLPKARTALPQERPEYRRLPKARTAPPRALPEYTRLPRARTAPSRKLPEYTRLPRARTSPSRTPSDFARLPKARTSPSRTPSDFSRLPRARTAPRARSRYRGRRNPTLPEAAPTPRYEGALPQEVPEPAPPRPVRPPRPPTPPRPRRYVEMPAEVAPPPAPRAPRPPRHRGDPRFEEVPAPRPPRAPRAPRNPQLRSRTERSAPAPRRVGDPRLQEVPVPRPPRPPRVAPPHVRPPRPNPLVEVEEVEPPEDPEVVEETIEEEVIREDVLPDKVVRDKRIRTMRRRAGQPKRIVQERLIQEEEPRRSASTQEVLRELERARRRVKELERRIKQLQRRARSTGR